MRVGLGISDSVRFKVTPFDEKRRKQSRLHRPRQKQASRWSGLRMRPRQRGNAPRSIQPVPVIMLLLLTISSPDASAFTRSRSSPLPRRHRPRNPELHLRPQKLIRCPRPYRSSRLALQRHLSRSHSARPRLHPAHHRPGFSCPIPVQQRRAALL